MIALTHPTGNANVRHALNGLWQARLLSGYYTTLGFTAGELERMPTRLARLLSRREYALPPSLLCRRPMREAIRLSLGERFFPIDSIYRDLDSHLARSIRRGQLPPETRALYAYEDGAAACFTAAREHGLKCVYEQPIGYWRAARKIYQSEAALQPAWASTLGGLLDSEEKLGRKDSELLQADRIIVATSFTQETLEGFPGKLAPVEVIPYGCQPSPKPPTPPAQDGPLKIIFVGGLSPRKGLSYLFAAIDKIAQQATLTLVGRKPSGCPVLDDALRQHHWIESLPHADILHLMAQHDVLVFPSLFEGFGLVITEALAQGLAVITTAHTAGPEFIQEGENGFIVPIRDTDAIAEKLELLVRNRRLLGEMKQTAWASSARRSWAHYESELAQAANKALD